MISNKKFSLTNINICITFYHTIKFILIVIITVFIFYSSFYINKKIKLEKIFKDRIINQNFFVIDSNNLENIIPHMYGFSVSKNGILTDNYYKLRNKYEEPAPQGIFVMIRKIGNKIIINQDFYGSFGLYIYENKDDDYFALSNSFLLLQEYLIEKQNISLNKDFSDNLIVTNLCSFSLDETLIKEIKQIQTNTIIVINIKTKKFKYYYIDYKENTIPLESKEGLNIIDKWIDKWVYIFRSLKRKTNNISADLSGGFDTRTMLSILLNSGINMNEININSIQDIRHDLNVDYKIASNISSKFGFKLNNFNLDKDITTLSMKETLYNTVYSKLGFHKEFYMNNKFYNKPRFSFVGSGGESLRGAPNVPIKNFINKLSLKHIIGNEKEIYNSSKRCLYRSISLLKNQKKFNNDYEISYSLYSKTVGRNHFGKSALENFLINIYILQPLLDPDIKKIKFDINNKTSHDLIAFIYVRFAHDLINFPFQGNRTLNLESIKKAERLNAKLKRYKIKSNINKNFYIDKHRRISSFISFLDTTNPYDYLQELFKSPKYFKIINKIYDKNVYNWANEYMNKTNYHPLSQHYALLAIAKTLEYLSINKRYMKKYKKLHR